MYGVEWLIVLGVLGLGIGIGSGFLIARRHGAGARRVRELETDLASSRQELADYRQQVVTQFSETARKFQTLNDSYTDLHQQLARSSSILCGDASTPLLAGPAQPRGLVTAAEREGRPESETGVPAGVAASAAAEARGVDSRPGGEIGTADSLADGGIGGEESRLHEGVSPDDSRPGGRSHGGEPSAALDEEPSAALDKEPSAALDKEPSAALDKEPSAALDKEPSAALDEEPSAAPDKEPAATSGDGAGTSPGRRSSGAPETPADSLPGQSRAEDGGEGEIRVAEAAGADSEAAADSSDIGDDAGELEPGEDREARRRAAGGP